VAQRGSSRSGQPDANALDVVIAGGGVAALEAALALRELAGDVVRLTLVAATEEFVYRPVAVLEPFTRQPPRRLPLADVAAELDATLVLGTLAAVDSEQRVLHTAEGREEPYGVLLVAVGATAGDVLPGAIAVDASRMDESLHELIQEIDSGSVGSVAFVAPGPTWPLPVYELALLAKEHAREKDVDLEITIVTAEPRPLAVFGEAVSTGAARLLANAGIQTMLGARLEAALGKLIANPGERELQFDRVVALPRLQGPGIQGLPADADGFLPITPRCQVSGIEHVYAAGDATDFPVKFGGIAAQQADAAAGSIAALAGVPAEPVPFDGVVHGGLLSGRKRPPLYFTARIEGNVARESEISQEPTWPADAKIAARYLTPYLDGLWAAGPRWIAGQLSWEATLSRLSRERSPAEPAL
jgi:sulfide:quinone oxidoreductase